MTNGKSLKRALLSSAFALIVSIAMLIGTTFAWFTDTASTAVNKIQSGTLKVKLLDENGDPLADNHSLEWVTVDDEVLWEPNCTYNLEKFQIKNAGKLALKYKLILKASEITKTEDGKTLLDVIDWTVKLGDETLDVAAADIKASLGADGGIAIITDKMLKAEEADAISVTAHMQAEAGNDYQNLSIGDFGVTVVAAQATYENDSFDDQYDKYAQYGERTVKNDALVKGSNGTYGLANTDNNSIYTKNITYSIPRDVYDGGFYAQHFGINSTFNGNGSTFKSFQLNCGYVPNTEESTLMVSNLTVEGDLIITASSNNVIINNCTAKHISVLGIKNDVSVIIDGCKVTGTPISEVSGNNKYGIYITRPVKTGSAKVSILNSNISDIKGHAIAVNSSGATCEFSIVGNTFSAYGLDGEAGRAAFKIWGDSVLAPTQNIGGEMNEKAASLAEAIKANNTFGALGENCVAAEFYGAISSFD